MRNIASRLSGYHMGQKLLQNRSISLRFRDKRVFAFNAEIQDGRQNFRQNCSISLCFQDKCVFAFSALIKIVTFSKLLISKPFCIGSLPKVNDFQTSI